MKKIIVIFLLCFSNILVSQSIEITGFNENPLQVSPLLGSDLIVNFKYTSEAGSTGNNIFIGLEILDSNNQYVSYINGVTFSGISLELNSLNKC